MRSRLIVAIASMSLAFAVIGCVSPSVQRDELPTYMDACPPGLGCNAGAGLIEGTLLLDGACLTLRLADGERVGVLWPRGYALVDRHIFNDAGEQVAEVGEPFRASGSVPGDEVAPNSCGAPRSVYVSEVVSS